MIKEIIGYTTAITALPKVDSGPDTNGHEYVDLGLPSGTLWATMNVGALSETEYGNYYMYGMGSKTYDSTDTPYDGTENPLDLSKDTARVVWGGDWHMPTKEQTLELIDNTTYTWTTVDGVNGGLFTAQNGNSVFIPAAGYWLNINKTDVRNSGCCYTSSTSSNASRFFMYFSHSSAGVSSIGGSYGYSVRPVIG